MDPVAAGGFAAASPSTARIRPAYARAAVGLVKQSSRRGGRVLDVAAGTGILAGQLARARLSVTAVEPLDPMVGHLRRTLPAVTVVRATAEALPFAASSVDTLTVGQALHRCSVDAVLAEASRVLRAEGLLAVLWNVRDQSVPWARAVTELVAARSDGRPGPGHGEPDRVEAVAGSGRFDDLRTDRFANPVPTTVAGVLDRVRSTSVVAAMGDADRRALLAEVAELLAAHDELRGTFEDPQETVVLRCRPIGTA